MLDQNSCYCDSLSREHLFQSVPNEGMKKEKNVMIDITSVIDIIRISIGIHSCWITKIKIGVDEHFILLLLLQTNSSY